MKVPQTSFSSHFPKNTSDQLTPANSLLLLASGARGLPTAKPKKFNSGHLETDIVRFLRQHKETEAERNQADFGRRDCFFKQQWVDILLRARRCIQREKGTFGIYRGGVVEWRH